MICPYCKKEVQLEDVFCPECGQIVQNSGKQERSDAYWKVINREDTERFRTDKSYNDEMKRSRSLLRNKKAVAAAVLLLVIGVVCLCTFRYMQFNDQMIAEVRSNLIGKTMTATSNHMEGLGSIYYEYWQLTFLSDGTVRYAYIETAGPAESDEKPKYQGTYSYTISRSLTGKYTILVDGATYELEVSGDNVPWRIYR